MNFYLCPTAKLYVKTEEKSAAPVFDSACSLETSTFPFMRSEKMSSAWLDCLLSLFLVWKNTTGKQTG